jgi:hypothetical protein
LDNDIIITDDINKAELFNNYFVDISTIQDTDASHLENIPTNLVIPQLIIYPAEVEKLLMGLDVTKSTGPDCIGNRLLKYTAHVISPFLTKLFQKSIDTGYFPKLWKTASIIPIFKKGNRQLCSNYRPISLLPCISKVFERIVCNHVYSFLKQNKLIYRFQSGFQQNYSTITQLIHITTLIQKPSILVMKW